MKEDITNKDWALREALRQDANECPPMPEGLNTRLMKRVEKEVNGKPRHRIALWPLVAAACVAGVIEIVLAPPKFADPDGERQTIAKVDINEVKQDMKEVKADSKPSIIDDFKPAVQSKKTAPKEERPSHIIVNAETQKQETVVVEEPPLAERHLTKAEESSAMESPEILTERDIPITRPENLKYTKEELALMKQQANEAFLKWVELELEIAKYNLESTTDNR